MDINQPQDTFTTTSIFGAISPQHDDALEAAHFDEKSAVEAINALPAGSALMVVTRGPNLGARFLLKSEPVIVGRSTSADIFLDDITVSRKHATIYAIAETGGHGVRDTGSLNGTYVNRERTDDIVLKAGDEVQIGKYRMIYYPSPQAPAANPA